jgi:hypothetical protein
MKYEGFKLDIHNQYTLDHINDDLCCISWLRLPKYANPGVLIFTNADTNQKLYYYYSMCFPNMMVDELESQLSNCDTLICCNHDPHIDILKYMKKQVHFVGMSNNAIYKSNKVGSMEKYSLFKLLQSNPSIVASYVFLSGKNKQWQKSNSVYHRKL